MKEIAKRRKNFLPTLIIVLIAWITWAFIFLKIPPGTLLSFSAFYFSLFLASFLTSALILGNSRRGALISTAIIGFIFLRQMRLASILNIVLLIGSLLSLEVHFSRQ